MTLKNTFPDRAGSYHANQKLVRRWYHVEGETGSHRNFTSVSIAFDTLLDAEKEMALWHAGRNGMFEARIVVTDETRKVLKVVPENFPYPRKGAKL